MTEAGTARLRYPLDGRRAWAVWGAAISVYVLAVFHRTSLGVAGLEAADRFGITLGPAVDLHDPAGPRLCG